MLLLFSSPSDLVTIRAQRVVCVQQLCRAAAALQSGEVSLQHERGGGGGEDKGGR